MPDSIALVLIGVLGGVLGSILTQALRDLAERRAQGAKAIHEEEIMVREVLIEVASHLQQLKHTLREVLQSLGDVDASLAVEKSIENVTAFYATNHARLASLTLRDALHALKNMGGRWCHSNSSYLNTHHSNEVEHEHLEELTRKLLAGTQSTHTLTIDTIVALGPTMTRRLP